MNQSKLNLMRNSKMYRLGTQMGVVEIIKAESINTEKVRFVYITDYTALSNTTKIECAVSKNYFK